MEADIQIPDKVEKKLPYQEEYNLAVALGITDGTEPNKPATRAQVAIMAFRAAKIADKLDKIINERR